MPLDILLSEGWAVIILYFYYYIWPLNHILKDLKSIIS